MISSEVERTLVKSPPELWTELSDPAALARHLGELGDIRITRVEPEHAVEWEAEGTTGTVRIKPSGWGTKVTLSVTRELAAPEPESPDEPEVALETGFEADVEPLETENEAAPGIESLAPGPALEPRRGFFARLFGGRRKRASAPRTHQAAPTLEPGPELAGADAFAAVRQALAPEAVAAVDPFAPTTSPAPEPGPAPAPALAPTQTEQPASSALEMAAGLAAELKAAEEIAAEEVTAVLTSVLDRLGAAHHRPFSRA